MAECACLSAVRSDTPPPNYFACLVGLRQMVRAGGFWVPGSALLPAPSDACWGSSAHAGCLEGTASACSEERGRLPKSGGASAHVLVHLRCEGSMLARHAVG